MHFHSQYDEPRCLAHSVENLVHFHSQSDEPCCLAHSASWHPEGHAEVLHVCCQAAAMSAGAQGCTTCTRQRDHGADQPHLVASWMQFSAAPGGNAAGSAVFAGGAAYGEELPGVAAVTAGGSLVMLTKPAVGASWSPESNLTAVLHWSLGEPGVLVQAGSLQKPIAGISTDRYGAVSRRLWHRAGQALEPLRALGLWGEQGDLPAVSASQQSQGAPAGPKQAQGQALAHLLRLRQLLCEDDAAAAHAHQLGPHNAAGSVQSVTAVTQGGALVECKRLSSAQHALLLAVQQAAVKTPGLRPLGGLGLAQEKVSHVPGGVHASGNGQPRAASLG